MSRNPIDVSAGPHVDASRALGVAIKNSGIDPPSSGALARAWPIAAIASALAFLADRGRFGVIVRAGFWALLLRGRSVVVLQETAQMLSAGDAVVASRLNASREDQDVAQALMIALMVIMRDELGDRSS